MTAGWRQLPRAQRWWLAALAVLLAAAQVRQPYPEVAPLQHIPTLVFLLAAPGLLRRWPLSDRALACITLFLMLHTIGGRYTYSNVPYDEWAQAVTGHTISAAFGFSRNHWDRLVHFSYGLLAILPVSELLERHAGLRPRLALYFAIESVLAVSALYEIFEWLLAVAMAGPLADAYNGQQGDIWDAQNDMGCAAIGAFAMAAIVAFRRRGSWQTR